MTLQAEDTARRSQLLYDQTLKHRLESAHADKFVAIEPISGDYFLGDTLSEAIGAARRAHPTCLVHAVRVGHKAALHFGTTMQ